MNTTASNPKLAFNTSRQFVPWLHDLGASLVFTTYQANKIFMLGTNNDKKLAVTERTFEGSMGLAIADNGFWASTSYQLWKFENQLYAGQTHQQFDKLYLPKKSYVTGDLDIHDIVDLAEGPIFVNTLFNCLATVSERHSFTPIWKPSFISSLVAEDRCHLNGLATRDGRPVYVTAVAKTDVVDGWRDHRQHGGVVIDVQSDEIICEGLSMPHSPRWHKGKLWLLDAGSGYFGYIDKEAGHFERVTFCPGFLRGLDFIDNYAIIGLSTNRKDRTFKGLALDNNLDDKNVSPRCGIYVVDLNSGNIAHWLHVEGIINEIYDVKILPNVKRPMLIGTKNDEIKRLVSFEGNVVKNF